MKLREFEFSKQLRKDTEFVDFVNELNKIINQGIAAVITSVSLTGQTAAISTTTLYTPIATAFFRVSVYMIVTTTGTGTLSCTIGWTDSVGAKTISPAGNVDLSVASSGATGISFIVADPAAITYETAIAGLAGNPVYSLYIVLEQLA